MTGLILADANVVLYSRDLRYPEKMRRCVAWLTALALAGRLAISPQTAAEHQRNAVRKLGDSRESAAEATQRLLPFCPAPTGVEVITRALWVEQRYKTSWWDAMQLGYAVTAGCSHLLTEDHQGVAEIEGVRLLDPFKTTPEQVLG